MSSDSNKSRRSFLKSSSLLLGATAIPVGMARVAQAISAPTIITRDSARPLLEQGLQIGDISRHRAVVWSRADRPARMYLEYAFNPEFTNAVKIRGPFALETSDYTARMNLTRLPTGQELWVRVSFQDLSNERVMSEVYSGYFRTAPEHPRNIRFLWSGDTAGQGWGINPDFGGMKIYETMRQTKPDFFIHSGDNIYADGPISESIVAENGETWNNIVTPEVSKVAESLSEYRGRYKYNLLDTNIRRFNSEVPQIWQWDDHEIVNNWSDSKNLSDDDRYTEKNIPLLVARGTQAFLEYAPMRVMNSRESERVYRHIPYGPLLDVFVLDMRSYRAANSYNRQESPNDDTVFLGAEQLAWIKRKLSYSKAVWKVIASDMPIGLQVGDGLDAEGRPRFENLANGNGPVLGREFEMAGLLRHIKNSKVKNVVWFTADVHYCAAHYYDPNKAQFQDFEPFWEFVTGPLNAGSFGPNDLDDTFGPQVIFEKAPPAENYSPFAGLQFFGQVDIDSATGTMSVHLKDINGDTLHTQEIQAMES